MQRVTIILIRKNEFDRLAFFPFRCSQCPWDKIKSRRSPAIVYRDRLAADSEAAAVVGHCSGERAHKLPTQCVDII